MRGEDAESDSAGLAVNDCSRRDELIMMIYRTAARLDQWPFLLDRLGGFFPGGRVLLWLRRPGENGGTVVLPSALASAPVGATVVSDMLDPARVQILRMRIPLAFRDVPTGDAPESEAALLVTRPLGASLAADSLFLRRLAPVFASAAEIGARLIEGEDDRATLVDILDRLPVGALVVDETARLLAANRQGRLALRERRVVVADATGRIRARAVAAQRDLADAIARTTTANARRVPVKVEDGDRPATLLVCSMAAGREAGGARRALVLMADRAGAVPRLGDAARDIYGLSAIEMRIVQGLVEGARLECIAAAGRTSVHTVRNQLKSIFIKVGVNRQADLVNLILRGPAPFGGE